MKTNANKQVAAFDQVLGHCNALGTKYNPSMDSVKVAALNSIRSSAQESLKAADTAKSNLIQAVNARQKEFAPLPGIGTRILNVLAASDASPQLIADIKKYRDKLRSPRTGKTVRPEDNTTPAPRVDTSRGPVSYLDYESRINTFGTILDLIRSEPLYNPNEQEFTVNSLTALYNTLREKNKAVNDAQVALRNARLSMRVALYSEAGLFGAAKRVKKYVLFAFGATSDQFRTFRSISLKSK